MLVGANELFDILTQLGFYSFSSIFVPFRISPHPIKRHARLIRREIAIFSPTLVQTDCDNDTRALLKITKVTSLSYNYKGSYFESPLTVIIRPPHDKEPIFNIKFSCFSNGLTFESCMVSLTDIKQDI